MSVSRIEVRSTGEFLMQGERWPQQQAPVLHFSGAAFVTIPPTLGSKKIHCSNPAAKAQRDRGL